MPPDQIDDASSKNPKFEVQGGLVTNHRITVFDKNHPQLADPRVRQAITHAIDRQAIVDSLWAGRTRVPPGLQWEFYGPMFIEDWTVPAYDRRRRRRRCLKAANYKGDPIPFRVLNNYYTNQVATAQIAGRDVARRRPQRADRDARELAADLRERRQARGARLVQQRRLQRSDELDRRPARPAGPAAAGQGVDQRRDEQALRHAGDRDRHGQAQGDVQAHAGDLRARGPRLHGAAPERDLHRQAQGHRVEGGARLRDGFPRGEFPLELARPERRSSACAA